MPRVTPDEMMDMAELGDLFPEEDLAYGERRMGRRVRRHKGRKKKGQSAEEGEAPVPAELLKSPIPVIEDALKEDALSLARLKLDIPAGEEFLPEKVAELVGKYAREHLYWDLERKRGSGDFNRPDRLFEYLYWVVSSLQNENDPNAPLKTVPSNEILVPVTQEPKKGVPPVAHPPDRDPISQYVHRVSGVSLSVPADEARPKARKKLNYALKNHLALWKLYLGSDLWSGDDLPSIQEVVSYISPAMIAERLGVPAENLPPVYQGLVEMPHPREFDGVASEKGASESREYAEMFLDLLIEASKELGSPNAEK